MEILVQLRTLRPWCWSSRPWRSVRIRSRHVLEGREGENFLSLRGKRGEQGDYNLVGLAGLRKNAMSIILYAGRMFMNFHKYLNMDVSLLGASCFCLGVSFTLWPDLECKLGTFQLRFPKTFLSLMRKLLLVIYQFPINSTFKRRPDSPSCWDYPLNQTRAHLLALHGTA